MEAGAVLPLLFLLCATSTATFYGDSINFKAPIRNEDRSLMMSIYHRVNGREDCGDQSSFTCEDNGCLNLVKSTVYQTSQDKMEPSKWCQAASYTTVNISADQKSITLNNSGCCWLTNAQEATNFVSFAEMDLGIRSDVHTQNSCPVTATVSRLRLPQNCIHKLNPLAYDPDRDHVKCSFAPGTIPPANLSLDADSCMLKSTSQLEVGVHVFALILEDFPTHNISVMYNNGMKKFFNMTSPPLCRVTLHFSLDVLPPVPTCEPGKGLPMFLSMTPFHGDVIYATVGEVFKLHANAQAQESSIEDFQVSGPISMTKEFTAEANGKAKMTLSWTPHEKDMYRFVPVCFTAETNQTQSDMRCVVIVVTESTLVKGKATVHCSPDKMTVAIEKASAPDLDMRHLMLLDDSCSLSSNSTHILGSMSFKTCGTKVEDQGDYIAVRNEIHSYEAPTDIIIRQRTVKIDFFCQFPKTVNLDNYYRIRKSDYIFTESSFGSFSYTFDIFKDNKFTERVEPSAYPVQVKLLEQFYLGIRAQSELPQVKLFVESCKGIPDENPNNTIAYELIKDGCSVDSSLRIHSSNKTTFNFEVEAFKFTGDYDQVYISCTVLLCDMNSPFSRCAQGCLQSTPSSRRKRDSGVETFKHSIIQGPMLFAKQDAPVEKSMDSVVVKQSDVLAEANIKSSEGGWGIMQRLSTNISNIAFANLFLVSLVLLAGVFLYFTRKRRAEEQKCLVDSDSN